MLRAQLLEEGLDVEAHESVSTALDDSASSAVLPALLVADLSASENPAAEIDQLTEWSKRIPVWIIASRNVVNENDLKDRGFEVILFKPVDEVRHDVGQLVERIKRRLKA